MPMRCPTLLLRSLRRVPCPLPPRLTYPLRTRRATHPFPSALRPSQVSGTAAGVRPRPVTRAPAVDATGPNAEQITSWNDQLGPKWVARQGQLDGMIAPLGRVVMDALAPGAGEQVIDVGCGCGDTTLALADRVGAEGGVLGVDVSEVMLAHARRRAAGVPNVRFLATDAQPSPFPPARPDEP